MKIIGKPTISKHQPANPILGGPRPPPPPPRQNFTLLRDKSVAKKAPPPPPPKGLQKGLTLPSPKTQTPVALSGNDPGQCKGIGSVQTITPAAPRDIPTFQKRLRGPPGLVEAKYGKSQNRNPPQSAHRTGGGHRTQQPRYGDKESPPPIPRMQPGKKGKIGPQPAVPTSVCNKQSFSKRGEFEPDPSVKLSAKAYPPTPKYPHPPIFARFKYQFQRRAPPRNLTRSSMIGTVNCPGAFRHFFGDGSEKTFGVFDRIRRALTGRSIMVCINRIV